METEKRTPVSIKLLVALAILLFLGFGGGAMKVFFENQQEGQRLERDGVVVEADVLSATEYRRPRGVRYTKINVSYAAPGPELLEFAEVQDCDGARFEAGTQTVDIVYLPDDPEVVRLTTCRSSFDSQWLPGIMGVALIGFGLFTIWRTRRLWRG